MDVPLHTPPHGPHVHRPETPKRWGLPLVLVGLVVAIGWYFRDLLTLFVLAFAAAYILEPLVELFERRRVPRSIAIVLVFIFVGVVLTAVFSVAIPDIVQRVADLKDIIPAKLQNEWIPGITRGLLYLRHKFHVRIPVTADAWVNQLAQRASSLAVPSVAVVLGAASASVSVVEFVIEVIIVLALTFYFLLEYKSLKLGAVALIPLRARETVRRVAGKVDDVLGRYVRGQILVMFILGALFAIGLKALGLKGGVGLGILAGMISFIPYLGFFIALGIAAFMAALDVNTSVLLVVSFMMVVHIVDITTLTPRVLGGSIGLSPIVIILALLAGAKVLGLLGLLVAVPAAAVARVILGELVDYYRGTKFYNEPPTSTLGESATISLNDGTPLRLTQPPPDRTQ